MNLPTAQEIYPVAYLASHRKVLLRRERGTYETSSSKTVGPEVPEYYLLDAQTGETRLTSGVFEPLHEEGKRFLQPTRTLEVVLKHTLLTIGLIVFAVAPVPGQEKPDRASLFKFADPANESESYL